MTMGNNKKKKNVKRQIVLFQQNVGQSDILSARTRRVVYYRITIVQITTITTLEYHDDLTFSIPCETTRTLLFLHNVRVFSLFFYFFTFKRFFSSIAYPNLVKKNKN